MKPRSAGQLYVRRAASADFLHAPDNIPFSNFDPVPLTILVPT
ncbi:MAG: hypothetical protein M0Z99_27460 [Betaproteobacteria bacterium]|nr:hypothetical protein [Betaproteobacteria bacterium]